MTEKLRNLLEDVQTVYEGKGMVVHPNSFDRLRMEVIKLDNINKQQNDQLTKAKEIIKNLFILKDDHFGNTKMEWRVEVTEQAEQFLQEIKKC